LKNDMLDRDFFGFCTTLKPLELKALGELSHVLHLEAAENVYAPRDAADAIFIISRGVVELVPDDAVAATAHTYLTRGDIFGDVETLTGLPRKHLVRSCEPASLQCFYRKDFPDLVRRIPTFFRYLSEQLALRLSQPSLPTLAQSHCLELSGSLANFDLVTIYQTILNSSQTGELRIANEKQEPVSAFFFEKGQPRSGQFNHLTGEEAFWQLFLHETLPGTFSFSSGEVRSTEWIHSEPIRTNPQDMLIAALQRRDEFADLKRRMADPDAILRRKKLNISWPSSAPAELESIAEQIWQMAYSAPVALSSLFPKFQVCELSIYRTIDELVRSNHFVLSSLEPSAKVA